MLLNKPAEYPETDKYNPLSEALLLVQKNHDNALPSVPAPQKSMLFCHLPGQVHHLKYWLTMYFADEVDIFHMYAEMGNDEGTEMQL